MFCPECQGEYRQEITHCPDCDRALVPELPPKPTLEWIDLATVLRTGDPTRLLVAESLLRAASVPFFALGEGLQELFALGRANTGFNPVIGPVQIQVPRPYRKRTKRLLKKLQGI